MVKENKSIVSLVLGVFSILFLMFNLLEWFLHLWENFLLPTLILSWLIFLPLTIFNLIISLIGIKKRKKYALFGLICSISVILFLIIFMIVRWFFSPIIVFN